MTFRQVQNLTIAVWTPQGAPQSGSGNSSGDFGQHCCFPDAIVVPKVVSEKRCSGYADSSVQTLLERLSDIASVAAARGIEKVNGGTILANADGETLLDCKVPHPQSTDSVPNFFGSLAVSNAWHKLTTGQASAADFWNSISGTPVELPELAPRSNYVSTNSRSALGALMDRLDKILSCLIELAEGDLKSLYYEVIEGVINGSLDTKRVQELLSGACKEHFAFVESMASSVYRSKHVRFQRDLQAACGMTIKVFQHGVFIMQGDEDLGLARLTIFVPCDGETRAGEMTINESGSEWNRIELKTAVARFRDLVTESLETVIL